ncbi:exopolysaccharide Pel transporter PelG [Paenibacillus sp. FA6]|uniref:exopolysaccharide Pel transporter PelG n=1 Tax=Paenibacillus sp. FA6 TaxID=3413029 RepID=UPI003F658D36
MAGIGFELRKLFREQGLSNTVKAYSFSAVTTIGPMILCMFLIIVLQRMMAIHNGTYLDWELYIATVQYCFIFSIIITSGITMVLTRFISDMIFEKKYDRLLSSYYGALMICLPLGALVVWLFLPHISASISYKVVAYLFFMELIVIWVQAVYLSALKDYTRIVRSFAIGVVISLVSGWFLLGYTDINATTAALLAIDIGFFVIAIMSAYHFEQVFSARKSHFYFEFLSYFRKFPSLFFAGTFFYAGIYIHSFVYWFIARDTLVAGGYWVSPFYDLPVFYAFISVIPTLVTFVVSVETAFYEQFRMYYKRVIEGGTYQEMERAKKQMQRTLMNEFSFLMEVQLLFTIVSIAIGMKLLPGIGFTMAQIDAFNLLVLGYFMFIMMFILLHLLLYFDDRKGVLIISSSFVVMNAALTYWTMQGESDGLGMFIASVLAFVAAIARLMYVLRNIDYFTFCRQPLTSFTTTTRLPGKWRKPVSVVSTIMVLTVVLSACTAPAGNSQSADESTIAQVTKPTAVQGLSEDKRIYEKDDDGSIKGLYVTVLSGKDNDDNQLNWYGLNRDKDRYNEDNLKVIVQEGDSDGKGPTQGLFGYGQSEPNANISLRGNTARYTSQKSYKIRLSDEAGLWNNQRTINLNKHSLDLSRIRNKLSFDLFEAIPNFTSLRTQFVRVYVKDQSEGVNNDQYEDYGLYTQIEQPNKNFLKSHWLDPYGQLYKVAFFEFGRYPDEIKSQSDPTYDKEKFETILEIKGREDHDKLIAMLDDVNNMSIPIDEVVDKHFDLDNYLTWLAVNILTDNMDTDANNFYLYSPLNSDKWYFLPWDYDGGWELQRNLGDISDYQSGLSNYWGSSLHNRYFRSEAHINQLKGKIEEMSQIINKDTVAKQLEVYQAQVEPFLTRSPDLNYLPGKKSEIATDFKSIAEVPERSIQRFLEDLEKPKPFFLDDVDVETDEQTFSWGLSYDFQGDDLVYDVSIALDPAFKQIVREVKDITSTTVTVKGLKKGTYYWKAVVRDSAGHEQIAFETYFDDEGDVYYGVKKFEVY